MASVSMKFIPPDREGLVALLIYECDNKLGPFNRIERIDDIGTYPGYIDNWTTDKADSEISWFSIQWIDDKGAESPMSVPIQGGVSTVVGKVTERVLQRDHSLDAHIVVQEAEATIETYTGEDPYSLDPDALGYRKLNGMVYLVLARVTLWRLVQSSSVSDVQVGLVRMSSRTNVGGKSSVQDLFDIANQELGINTSFIAEMQRVRDRDGVPAYGQSSTYILILEP